MTERTHLEQAKTVGKTADRAMMEDLVLKALARYAFMLRLPAEFTDEGLRNAAVKYEQCPGGPEHAAWRQGYFGDFNYGLFPEQWAMGAEARRDDCCPTIPPGFPFEEARRDWKPFDDYFAEVRQHRLGAATVPEPPPPKLWAHQAPDHWIAYPRQSHDEDILYVLGGPVRQLRNALTRVEVLCQRSKAATAAAELHAVLAEFDISVGESDHE